MLVKSALLNLEVQKFFASCLPLVLFSVCLSFSPSFTHSLCHTLYYNVFPFSAHGPVDFKVSDVLPSLVTISWFSAELYFERGA